jgi:hydrogenase maturation protease
VHVFQADHDSASGATGIDAHSMDPQTVFANLRALGGTPPYTVVVGCEAGTVEENLGLSAPVAAAVPRAVSAVQKLVAALQTSAPAEQEC